MKTLSTRASPWQGLGARPALHWESQHVRSTAPERSIVPCQRAKVTATAPCTETETSRADSDLHTAEHEPFLPTPGSDKEGWIS